MNLAYILLVFICSFVMNFTMGWRIGCFAMASITLFLALDKFH